MTGPRRTTRGLRGAALAVCLVASGCAAQGASPGASATPRLTATPLPTEVATSTPVPMLESTTEEANGAPAGAITLDIRGAKFLPDEVTAEAGTVVFFLMNETDGTAHNMLIGPDIHSPALAKSETLLASRSAVFTVYDLPAGTYAIWCSIENHVSFGMVGTLTVTP